MATNQNTRGGSSEQHAKAGSQSHKNGSSNRGFASMDPQQQRQIASMGGHAAHQKGTAHEFDSEEARRAGQKGGEAVSRNRAHMADIGRKGGESRQSASRAAAAAAGGTAKGGSRQGGKEQ